VYVTPVAWPETTFLFFLSSFFPLSLLLLYPQPPRFSLSRPSQRSITKPSNPPLSHSNFHYFSPFSSLFPPLLAYSSIKHLLSPLIIQILTAQTLTLNIFYLKSGHFKVFSCHSIVIFCFLIVQTSICIPYCTSTSPVSLSKNFTITKV